MLSVNTLVKAAGRQADIQGMLKSTDFNVPKDLAYVTGSLLEQYLNDMKIAQEFAALNRQAIVCDIVKAFGLHVEEQFTTTHNYIDLENNILRIFQNSSHGLICHRTFIQGTEANGGRIDALHLHLELLQIQQLFCITSSQKSSSSMRSGAGGG